MGAIARARSPAQETPWLVIPSLTMPLEASPLADYELAESLGTGATANVFEATHKPTGLVVAIKMLEPSQRGSHELRTRLEREARVLAGVRSPHVARLLGYGWEKGQPFLVLERLTGETLADVLKRDAVVTAGRLVDWVEQLLLGVRDIHAAGVIHRDIKPANLFLVQHRGGDPLLKLIDFGVARLKEIAMDGMSLTSTHHLIGSMGYMAPEQLEYAKGVGPAADLYAVGVVVFRCVTGRLPFMGRSFEALQKLKMESDPPLLSAVTVVKNEALDAFVARALSRSPEERFASAGDMLEAWWRVAASLSKEDLWPREPTIPEYDVVLEDTETIIEYDRAGERQSVRTRTAHEQTITTTSSVVRALADEERRLADSGDDDNV